MQMRNYGFKKNLLMLQKSITNHSDNVIIQVNLLIFFGR